MEMGLVEVDNSHLVLAHLLIQSLKVGHKFSPPLGFGFAQQFREERVAEIAAGGS